MPLQSDIISAVQRINYIIIVKCAAFFHQWPIQPDDLDKSTIVSHRGNEQWNVAVMGFKNNLAYVQIQIGGLLKPFKTFVKTYIDDVVIFNKTLKKHTSHFEHVFNLFDKMNMALKLSKSYIGYPTIALLNQKFDNFGLNISADKFETIRTIKFPRKFKNFETYVGMTNYFRNYVPYYIQLMEPLQRRKIKLLRNSFFQNNVRKTSSKSCKINFPSETEKNSFNVLQAVLSRPFYLVHYDPNRFLHIDVNASK